MNYSSTRGGTAPTTLSEALVAGLASGAANLRTSGPVDLVYDVAGWFTA